MTDCFHAQATICPVNKPHPRLDMIVSGSSRSLYAWRPTAQGAALSSLPCVRRIAFYIATCPNFLWLTCLLCSGLRHMMPWSKMNFLSLCVRAEEGEGGVRARSASGALPGPSSSTPRSGAAGASASFVFWDVGDEEKKKR